MSPQIFAFEVWIAGRQGQTVDDHGTRSIVNTRTAGMARYSHLLAARDWCQGVTFIQVRARKVGPPVTSDGHRATMKSRGRPELVAGARVTVDGLPGFITGGNYSSNFDVLLDHMRFSMNVHPTDIAVMAVA
jgi:hypothetical protein